MKIYTLEHLTVYPEGEERVKSIGIFSSYAKALGAMMELQGKPGFRNAPKLIDTLEDGFVSGFIIDERQLDKISWTTGFG